MKNLDANSLVTRCDPSDLAFETTAELAEPDQPFGQMRAIAALRLGIEASGAGYNMFVLGSHGGGRHRLVEGILAHEVARHAPPSDWCYVYNFKQPNKPRALRLPAGQGGRLRDRMHVFVGEVGQAIEAVLDSDAYRARIAAIQKEVKQREEGPLQALGDKAVAQGVALLHTPQGFALAPLKDGEPMSGEQLDALSDGEREHLDQVMEGLREELAQMVQSQPRLRRDMRQRIRHASREAMALAAGHLIDELKQDFADLPQVIAFLDEVLQDVVESGESLREQSSDDEELARFTGTLSLMRYEVNLLVGHAADGHAPVRHCDNPTYPKLMGRIDQLAHMGTLLTNFTLIQPGALHEANGGYLLLDALQVLREPGAWDALKRALRHGEIAIEALPQLLGWSSTLSLEPEPIPLRIKVVLFGERDHYCALQALDTEFAEHFKVAVDLDDDVPRDAAHTQAFARLVGSLARAQGLRPLDRAAVASMVEQAARRTGHGRRLSTHVRPLQDLLQEADLMAARVGHAVIEAQDVRQARDAAVQRLDRLRVRLCEDALQDAILIATEGEQVGEVNGLAVTDYGEHTFGHPVRITATVRLGEGELVDILRESGVGQPLHTKGVMILAAFLGARYARGLPLSLRASLVFEQAYGPVEGDSASLAETCALLSALSGAPVRQSLAVTGSINQFGQVQAVGAVNEKIEGFFDLCVARGLDGAQGVLIPSSNIQNLMLREDVISAVAQGRFRIWAVDDVDDAVSLLTGLPAGRADALGHVADGSVNPRVAVKLEQLSLARQAWSTGRAQYPAKAWPRRPVSHRGSAR